MNWSVRRKLFYLLITLLFAGAVSSYFLIPLFVENPTCFDGKQNGDETGVDCSGSCSVVCSSDVHPLSIVWQRAFLVAPGIYDVLGYIENLNAAVGIPEVLYRFKLYDENNVLIAERDGRTFVGPNQSWAIFEGGLKTGERLPKRVFLEFESGYKWTKINPGFDKIAITVTNKDLSNASTSPRLQAVVTNNSLTDLRGVEAVAIVRNADDNALAVSKTVVDRLSKQNSADVFFTWLKPLSEDAARIEVIPRVNPFNTNI